MFEDVTNRLTEIDAITCNLTGERALAPEFLEELLVSRKKLSDRLGPPSSWGDRLTELMTKDEPVELEPCDIPNRAWCEDRVKVVCEAERLTRGLCSMCGEVHFLPRYYNRFDPYEALDTIENRVREEELDCDDREDVFRATHALRAYITGMEK